MKKRLISMLMAVLMIASLLPASAVFATDSNTCPADPAGKGKHEYTTVKIQKDTEKKTPGVDFKVCKNCGEIKTDSIIVTRFKLITWGHTCSENATMVAKEATCRNQGLTISYCTECGKGFANEDFSGATYKVDAKLAHVYDDFHVEVAPTCKVDGWGYVLCKNCGDPQFIKDADAAVGVLSYGNYANAGEYQKRYNEVREMFVKNNIGHKDTAKLITVTKEMTLPNNTEVHPANSYIHAKTISGTYNTAKDEVVKAEKTNVVQYAAAFADDGKTITFNVSKTFDEVHSRSADKYCPDCYEVIPGETGQDHVLGDAPKKLGYAPYVDENGYMRNGKTDTWECKTCRREIGGETLYYSDYFNPNDKNNLVNGLTMVIPGYAAECSKDEDGGHKGMTDTTIVYNKTEGKWEVKYAATEIPVPAHKMVDAAGVDPTCEKEGYIYKNCRICEKCGHIEGSDEKVTIPALKHDYKPYPLVSATCYHNGLTISQCTKCGDYEKKDGAYITKITGKETKHVASDKLANVKEATCTEEGYTGDVVCKFCGEVMKPGEKTKMVDHTPVDVEAKAPTCTEPGVTKGTVCSVCKKVLSAQETVPALGHDPKLVNAKDATCTEAGYTGDKVCTRCNVTLEKGKDIKALGHNFVKGVCSRCDAKQPGYMPFKDVKTTDQFYSDIMWAWENGIVEGDNTGMFRADGKLTRAQVVTMLWRLYDKPTAKTAATFTDLTQDWYKDAVAWAVEKGIVNGVGNNKFAPNETCTRAQIVTMLWRLNGSQKVTPTINFTDLTQDWYKDAVAWAANNGITKGDGASHFYPANDCTRGEAVAFIHRTAVLGK